MVKYIRDRIKGLIIVSLSSAILAASLPQTILVGYLAYLPPVAYTKDEVPHGLAVDIFREATASLQWVLLHDH